MSVEAPAGLEGLVAVATGQSRPRGSGLRGDGLRALSHLGEAVQQVELGLRGGHGLRTEQRKPCSSGHRSHSGKHGQLMSSVP